MHRESRTLAVIVIAGIAFAIGYLVYMRIEEGPGSVLGQIESWVMRHDQKIDLITVWCLAVGFLILALVEGTTWWALHHQHDETDVGKTLKVKKAAYSLICGTMGLLYSLTLYGYYQDHQFTIWERLTLRVFVIIGIASASILGVRFILALRAENWGRPP